MANNAILDRMNQLNTRRTDLSNRMKAFKADPYAATGVHKEDMFFGRGGAQKIQDYGKSLEDEQNQFTQDSRGIYRDALAGSIPDAPQKLGMEAAGSGYKAKTFDQPLPEFEQARTKVNEQANQAGSAASEALKRRFAAMGALNSGAAIKSQEEATNENETRRLDALSGVNNQEAAAKRGLEQGEADKEFQANQALVGRNMQRELYNADQDFKSKLNQFDSYSKLAQLDMGFDQQDMDKRNNDYNMELSKYQADHSGGLFGGGGFLGLGL